MIIRILGEGQYRLDDKYFDDLNTIDNRIVDHVNKGNHTSFQKDLNKLIATVKEQGEPIDPVDIVQSDLIVPPGDLTFEEAKKIFSDEGLIED